jgi:predicted phage replisome organizer
MADNEKYYYIKLKDNYFEQDNIKVLESMKNGHTYSLIIIKLYLKASKTDGQLMMTQRIPYDPSNVGILASVIGHDVDHVKEAIRLGIELDLIKVIDGKEIWMTEIQNMIGQSSTEADRIRSYRKKLDEKLLPESTDVQMYDKSTPEIEKEKELEIEKKKELETDKQSTNKLNKEQVYFDNEELNQIFLDFIADRKKRGKKMTDKAIELTVKKLKGFRSDSSRIKAITESIANGWIGIFEPAEDSPKKKYDRTANANFDGLKSGEVDF